MKINKQRISPYFAIWFMVAWIVIQIIVSRTTTLTYWKMGGFGMFSTLDYRVITVEMVKDGQILPTIIPLEFEYYFQKVLNFPNPYMINMACNKLYKRDWTIQASQFEGDLEPTFTIKAADKGVRHEFVNYWKPDEIRVKVSEMKFDYDTLEIKSTVLAEGKKEFKK